MNTKTIQSLEKQNLTIESINEFRYSEFYSDGKSDILASKNGEMFVIEYRANKDNRFSVHSGYFNSNQQWTDTGFHKSGKSIRTIVNFINQTLKVWGKS